MAYLAPADLPALALSGGRSAELDTLDLLRRTLSSDYTVFHGVHWSRDWRSVAVFGEADFVVVNNAGAALVIEQKGGGLEETDEKLFKTYDGKRKSVARQIHRTLDAIRDKFRWQHKDDVALDYLLYCPDHRLRSLNAVGLDRSHVVDASDDLAGRITQLLPPPRGRLERGLHRKSDRRPGQQVQGPGGHADRRLLAAQPTRTPPNRGRQVPLLLPDCVRARYTSLARHGIINLSRKQKYAEYG